MSDKDKNDTRVNPNELPPPTHNGRALHGGALANEDPLDVAAARFGISRKKAEDIFQYFDETMNSGDQMMTGSLAQAVAEATRQRDAEWVSWLGRILRELDVYARKQSGKDFVQMTIVTVMFVCGFGDYAGAKSFAEIARNELRQIRSTSGKATVTKCAAHFLAKLKLAPMLTQRTQAARDEMTKARQEQITKSKNYV